MKLMGRDLENNRNMLREIKHIRFTVLNDKQQSFANYWFVLRPTGIDPIGIEQNSTANRPWCVRT
jgi:hypothetical protein